MITREFAGEPSGALHYSRKGGHAIEVFFFGTDGKVVRAAAHYAA
jgi:hypothetical protein